MIKLYTCNWPPIFMFLGFNSMNMKQGRRIRVRKIKRSSVRMLVPSWFHFTTSTSLSFTLGVSLLNLSKCKGEGGGCGKVVSADLWRGIIGVSLVDSPSDEEEDWLFLVFNEGNCLFFITNLWIGFGSPYLDPLGNEWRRNGRTRFSYKLSLLGSLGSRCIKSDNFMLLMGHLY